MSANLRVFVSSTCSDLFQERRNIAETLLGLGHSVILSELPDAMPVNPRLTTVESCLSAIEGHTDLMCLVISGNYGSTDNSGKSITTREYLKAQSLGIPTMVFVRQRVWDLYSIYKNAPDSDFAPVVTDNRVFEFISQVAGVSGEKWVFSFTEAKDISETLKYQLSCFLRSTINGSPQPNKGVFHRYANNYSIRLHNEGWAHRVLEYWLVNNSESSIDRIMMGDTSDLAISTADHNLIAKDFMGRTLIPEYQIETPHYKRWELIFPEPLPPGADIKYSVSYLSSDLEQMQTGHNHSADHGYIRYIFPGVENLEIVEAMVRTPNGWGSKIDELTTHRLGGATSIGFYYENGGKEFQFRLQWKIDRS